MKQSKKLLAAFIALGMVSIILNGCIYSQNKSWEEMTPEEKQEVKQELKQAGEELEKEFSEDTLEGKLANEILSEVEGALDSTE
ncbi:MAG: hypothetical protein SOX11_04855 [Lachnospiraceae bacterium]|nr:hypothetical protein [Lachnospiraceae bacterium]MDY3222452.1 hypothetical protein [Lachnospiraceae bacterium]